MDQHPLDKFFKKKLEGREFPLQDAYWEAAQREIARRQWRKRLLWWGGSSLALILAVALGWWGMTSNERTMFSGYNTQSEPEQSAPATGNGTEQGASERIIDGASDENASSNVSDEIIEQANVFPDADPQADGKKKKSSSYSEKEIIGNDKYASTGNSLKTGSKDEKEARDVFAGSNDINSSGSGKDGDQKSLGVETEANPSAALVAIEEKEAEEISVEKTADESADRQGSEEAGQDDFSEEKQEWTTAMPLLGSGEALVCSMYSTEPYESEVKRFLMKRKARKRLHFGLTASLSLAGSLREADNLAAGLTVAWPLSPRLRLVAEPSWYSWTAGFDYRRQSPEITYSFGLQKRVHELQAQRLHYVGMPVYLQYGYGNLSLEGGLASKYLLVANAVYEYRDDHEQGGQALESRNGMLSRDQFNRLRLGGFAGLRYHLFSGFSLGLRATFDPQPVLSDTGDSPSGAFIEQRAGNWFWSVNVFYGF